MSKIDFEIGDVFCYDDCKYLSPKEDKQQHTRRNHYCTKYNEQVKHQGYHPKICRSVKCYYKRKKVKRYAFITNT